MRETPKKTDRQRVRELEAEGFVFEVAEDGELYVEGPHPLDEQDMDVAERVLGRSSQS